MPQRTAHLIAALMPHTGEPTDAELMARFAADREPAALELLVWRHAGLVLRTCREVLGDRHAAEDAAQAVFLALARQAGSVGRSGSVAGWLFRVARRVAIRAARRAVLPTIPNADLDAIPGAEPTSAPDPERDRVLHEELARLPDVYRSPVLLCFFEGLSHADAARRLGWPVGTVAGRIARAKDLLAVRLLRRGVTLSLLTPVGVAVAAPFVTATARAAVAFATMGKPLVSQRVLNLAQREVRMTVAKKVLGWGVFVVAACGFLVLGLRSNAEPPVVPSSVPRPMAADQGEEKSVAPIGRYQNQTVQVTVAQAQLVLIDTTTGECWIEGGGRWLDLKFPTKDTKVADGRPGRFQLAVLRDKDGRENSLVVYDTTNGRYWRSPWDPTAMKWQAIDSPRGK